MSFEMLRQEVDGDTAYIEWRAETTDNIFEVGSDTFIVGMENGDPGVSARFLRSGDFLPSPGRSWGVELTSGPTNKPAWR